MYRLILYFSSWNLNKIFQLKKHWMWPQCTLTNHAKAPPNFPFCYKAPNEAECTCHFTTFGPTKQKILNFKWFWFMEINFLKFRRLFPVMKISLWKSYKESEVKRTSIRNSIGMGGRCLMYRPMVQGPSSMYEWT